MSENVNHDVSRLKTEPGQSEPGKDNVFNTLYSYSQFMLFILLFIPLALLLAVVTVQYENANGGPE